MFRKAALLVLACWLSASAFGQTARHFTFHYAVMVRNPKPGARLRLWIPLAHSGPYQKVRILGLHCDLPCRKAMEPVHGNHLLYASALRATAPEYRFAIDYEVVRKEHVALVGGRPVVHQARLAQGVLARYLRPDRLVPTTGVPAQIASAQIAGLRTPLERARALYDYVLHNMRYDKSGTGWGRGDVLYACDAKKGNCTDFHSLFISLARSQGIPARFEIGFALPDERRAGNILGYHCWADFYLPGVGWVPVDISEAWQQPARREYFFGAHDASRVQFTLGRDLILSPRQDGPPLNYFVYPYVEMNGHEYGNVSSDFSFADVRSTSAGVGK
ncbi:MAG TPA: transglutaminase-like domain-containing protein [Terriglobales bacterium]|nr:transglutaminase-like domain-containing protein [Terriglobales bacterium]